MKISVRFLAPVVFALYSVPMLAGDPGKLAHDIYKELIEINTTESSGNVTKACEAVAARLHQAGFSDSDVRIVGDVDRKKNLVARLRGSGQGKPLLLLAHLDVVEANRDDWSVDPFTFLEKDGFYYGRGTTDDKAMAAIWIANLIRYKEEGFKPRRDIIVALTADEETGDANGVSWLLKNERQLIDAGFALNEGGGGRSDGSRYVYNAVQASEKVYITFELVVTNPGGHSSVPRKPNAIYQLAAGLTHLAAFEFPVQLNEITRAYFQKMSAVETGQKAADMQAVTKTPPDAEAVRRLSETAAYNAQLRTTCVATRLDAGHADNALPQTARATVNCRVLPGQSTEEVKTTMERVLGDPSIEVTWIDRAKLSEPSPLSTEVMGPIEKVTARMWPGVPVIPIMMTGATDGLYLRNAGIPTYGVSGLFGDINDSRAHGRDERMGVKQFYEGLEFLHDLVKELAD
ncbi:MAG: M20/M25/M40 family metallo-hydrolase [Acidobacteriota bacterium]